MPTMEELLDRQQQCIKQFLDRVKTVKKTPMERRTREKLSEKLAELRLLWTRIVEHHKKIVEAAEMPPEFHDTFNTAKAAYLDARKWIATQIPELWIADPMDRIHEEVVDSTEEASGPSRPKETTAKDVEEPADPPPVVPQQLEFQAPFGFPPPRALGTMQKTAGIPSTKETDTQQDNDEAGYADEEGEEEQEDGAKGGDTRQRSASLSTPEPNSIQHFEKYGYYNQDALKNAHKPTPRARPSFDRTSRQAPSMVELTQVLKMLADSQSSAQKENMETRREFLKLHQRKSAEEPQDMFDGDMTRYTAFRKTLQRYFEQRADLSEEDKALVLRRHLTGYAFQRIQALMIREGSLQLMWLALDESFDNKEKAGEETIVSLYPGLLKGKPEPRSYESLRDLSLRFHTFLRNIELLHLSTADMGYYLCIYQMDSTTKSRFMDQVRAEHNTIPTGEMVLRFIDKEMLTLQKTSVGFQDSRDDSAKRIKAEKGDKQKGGKDTKVVKTHNTSTVEQPKRERKCFVCNGDHFVTECEKFLKAPSRSDLLKQCKICIYCVKHRYDFKPCRARDRLKCDICSGQHITLMHPPPERDTLGSSTVRVHLCNNNIVREEVRQQEEGRRILATAEIQLLTPFEDPELADPDPVKCMLDPCSEESFVTEQLVQALQLKKFPIKALARGVGGAKSAPITSYVKLRIKTCDKRCPVIEADAFVVPKVTGVSKAARVLWKDDGRKLADPSYYKAARISVLLGLNVIPSIYRDGQEVRDGFIIQNTIFGWIISGSSPPEPNSCKRRVIMANVSLTEYEQQCFGFWDILIRSGEASELDKKYCEKLFLEKHKRMPDGRYVIPIPWLQNAPALGPTYNAATKFYLAQEEKRQRNPELMKLSNEFWSEYKNLNHMLPIPAELQKQESSNVHYLNWMSVMRSTAVTTKVRNVVMANLKTSTGVSLNDIILPGEPLQTEIFNILTSLRQYKYTYSGDVEKMFRQFLIEEKDRGMFRVLWRPSKDEPIGEYWLTTVTYGTDCAPWQALRGLHQIAKDNAPDERTAKIICTRTYMDDCITGGDEVEECREQIEKISDTLAAGKLTLTKWSANDSAVLADIEDEKKLSSYLSKDESTSSHKLLGILYDADSDTYSFDIKDPKNVKWTKRGLLSVVASMYDPTGMLLPVIMHLRIMMQRLWLDKYDWDDKLDEKTQQTFEKAIATLGQLRDVKIPRWTGSTRGSAMMLVGFSDASGDGYAAVIYSRVKINDEYVVRLIAAKGRVCPLKSKINLEIGSKIITMPKLELEAILLLTQLYSMVVRNFDELETSFIAYTDSAVALAWVRNPDKVEQKVVRRRVDSIKKVIKPSQLHWIPSADNAADHPSRGLTPEQYLECSQYTEGPAWLKDEELPTTAMKEVSEEEIAVHATRKIKKVEGNHFFDRFSSFPSLLRFVAYCSRWIAKSKRERGDLTAHEITAARKKILVIEQQYSMPWEYNHLAETGEVPRRNWMVPLTPFIDHDGLIRVGGRLAHAKIPYDQKHPILLKKGHLTDLIIRDTHLKTMHGGVDLMERRIRELYWIPAVRSRIKKCTRSCTTCIRFRGVATQPIMGQLPETRVNPSATFERTGVDLAGPFSIRASRIKFEKVIKVWLALFICLATKAVHIEIVSDLTAENFIAAFTRFASRRSVPKHIYSDNGTNFVGSNRAMREAWDKIKAETKRQLAIREIKWHFINPYAPETGGLWERNIRSLKEFARKMANIETMVYEEFLTLVCRIEGILNSRPMYPGTGQPGEELALTPQHFLTQQAWIPSTADFVSHSKSPVTKRWIEVRKLVQHFWDKFSHEYLSTLMKTYKWRHPTRNLQVDDVVLIQDPNAVPATWKMGVITAVHPDAEGTVRNVELKTAQKENIRRTANRLVPLLPDTDEPIPRRRKSNKSLATRVLMCWLALATASQTDALVMQPLPSGLHIQKLGDVKIKAFDLEFSVNTSINVTEDLEIIDQQLKEFADFCQ